MPGTAPTPQGPALIADDVAAVDPHPGPKCDHICLKDDGHVERGEPHFYGYELPSPRRPRLMNTPLDSIQYLLDVFIEGGYAEDDEDVRHLDEIHGWLMWAKDTSRRHNDGPGEA